MDKQTFPRAWHAQMRPVKPPGYSLASWIPGPASRFARMKSRFRRIRSIRCCTQAAERSGSRGVCLQGESKGNLKGTILNVIDLSVSLCDSETYNRNHRID